MEKSMNRSVLCGLAAAALAAVTLAAKESSANLYCHFWNFSPNSNYVYINCVHGSNFISQEASYTVNQSNNTGEAALIHDWNHSSYGGPWWGFRAIAHCADGSNPDSGDYVTSDSTFAGNAITCAIGTKINTGEYYMFVP
jgi:hypothetical protein